MKLFYSATSPFVRKVVLCAAIRDLDGQIERVPTDAHASPASLVTANPLSKVPCLVTEDGEALFDSPVICEYLDSVGEAPPLFPEHGARWSALRMQALADGMMDAAVLARMERMRPEEPTRKAVIARQLEAVSRGLALLEEHPPAEAHADIGSISVVCALGYLDFRFSELDWRAGHPRLARWYAAFTAELPGFAASVPPG
ncbi:MAG TPA: glutathione S-transferase [Acidisoma sp.]|jgi:glutathione S-transferase|uniref:glutathione S-transferase n=1 Tax=Acidisoma sp. TaxID=1872115 RepID=UPI002B7C4186|nr:glutathione S-transferase [Acidisoma sp.]HTH99409.1 glutathione S-transferase [Acidisoma sp.]